MNLNSTLDLNRWHRWLYVAWFNFVVTYRKTTLGPFWLLAGPALFIVILGSIFTRVNDVPGDIFLPYMAVGVILWTLIGACVTKSTLVFHRNRAQILQGSMTLIEISVVDIISVFLQFLHQSLILVVVFAIYGLNFSWYLLVTLLGIVLIVVNGFWLSLVFGILGARYRDLNQFVAAVMRVAFLATPILWMATSGRGQQLGIYLIANPFYHFLEIVRAPLLGMPISMTSWIVALSITAAGLILANEMYKRFGRLVPLWV
ncbi:MAG: ABC transporter permease [Methyloceanibacter sp.]|nr:ABC transporter permease [Methyloceanibacter sp.]